MPPNTAAAGVGQDASLGTADTALDPLSVLSQRFTELVRQWGVLSNRQASSIARFERHLAELTTAGARLEQDAATRVRELQEAIAREWKEMREAQGDPAQQLQDHATSLTQLCMTTIDAAQRNWERSEERLTAIERDLDRRLAELSRDVQAVGAELRALRPHWEAAGPAGAPWALDTVTQLHEEMRRVAQGEPPGLVPARRAAPADLVPQPAALSESGAALSGRLESLERDAADRETQVRKSVSRATRVWRWVTVGIVGVTALTATVAWQSRSAARLATEQVAEAQQNLLSARQEAAQEVNAVRDDARRRIEQATATAARARLVGDVMAAPDLVRYSMVGRNALAGATAQLRWSRTRGVIFSGSAMVSPPPEMTYQVWLVGRDSAVSVATFSPEPGGVATVASGPIRLPRPIVGAVVTLEPSDGSPQPRGEVVFTRPPPPPEAATTSP